MSGCQTRVFFHCLISCLVLRHLFPLQIISHAVDSSFLWSCSSPALHIHLCPTHMLLFTPHSWKYQFILLFCALLLHISSPPYSLVILPSLLLLLHSRSFLLYPRTFLLSTCQYQLILLFGSLLSSFSSCPLFSSCCLHIHFSYTGGILSLLYVNISLFSSSLLYLFMSLSSPPLLPKFLPLFFSETEKSERNR